LQPMVAERLRALRERPARRPDKGFGYPMPRARVCAGGHLARWHPHIAPRAGVELAPHGKTAMSPELVHDSWQAEPAASQCTIGPAAELYRAFGLSRLCWPNEW